MWCSGAAAAAAFARSLVGEVSTKTGRYTCCELIKLFSSPQHPASHIERSESCFLNIHFLFALNHIEFQLQHVLDYECSVSHQLSYLSTARATNERTNERRSDENLQFP